jgi:methylenetetrahydrofolate dehydrogenase (NADP+) / methenyltetrahydrofolate cyclohydrolase
MNGCDKIQNLNNNKFIMVILDGKFVQQQHKEVLQQQLSELNVSLALLIIQVGDNPQSSMYIERKKIFGVSIGVTVIHKKFEVTISQDELIEVLRSANTDPAITGVIVQLPLPEHLDVSTIINHILPEKDVDGLTTTNTQALAENREAIVPATARGIISILTDYHIPINGKHAVIIGRGMLVGKPIASCLKNLGAQITVCHRGTTDLMTETKRADILIVAAGVRGLITHEHVSAGQTIVDVGLTQSEEDGNKRLYGDVLFDDVTPIVGAITPSPGGVGPMTIVSLFENLLQAYNWQQRF